MIICGYPGIGKSSLAANTNNIIDLCVEDFYVNGVRTPDWVTIYCKIAVSLSNQNFIVFVSTHPEVIKTLLDYVSFLCIIHPDIKLKSFWVERLYSRYLDDKSLKNLNAYKRVSNWYLEDIEAIENTYKDAPRCKIISIQNIQYNLYDIVTSLYALYLSKYSK